MPLQLSYKQGVRGVIYVIPVLRKTVIRLSTSSLCVGLGLESLKSTSPPAASGAFETLPMGKVRG